VKDALLNDKAFAHPEQEASSAQDTEIPEAEEHDPSVTAVDAFVSISTLQDVPDELQAFISSHMATHLWHLAHMPHPTCDDKRRHIWQAIKEFDTMNSTNKNYHITRREALCSLATLPMLTLGLSWSGGSTLEPSQYGTAVAHCAASLEACWELYQSDNSGDLMLAFESVSKYLPALETIARDSSQYRKEALDLAVRYALLKTILGWHCASPLATIQFAKDAVVLSKETNDISLQLSAYNKLAWAYFYDKKYMLAFTTAQEAENHLQRYYQLPSAQPLHPCVQGGIYSTLALMQARNGRSPDVALGKATEVDPGDEIYAGMDFTRSTQLLESSWVHYYHGDQAKVLKILEQRIDPETLSPKIPQTEIGRVETIHIMALSSLKAKDRDMEKSMHFWRAAMEGAKTLQSEWGFSEALAIYEFMEFVWPGEQRITDLHDLIVHW
jgi:hypothetical protein